MKFYLLHISDALGWSDEVHFAKREAIQTARTAIRSGAVLDEWGQPERLVESACVTLHKVPRFTRSVVAAMLERHDECLELRERYDLWESRVVWEYTRRTWGTPNPGHGGCDRGDFHATLGVD